MVGQKVQISGMLLSKVKPPYLTLSDDVKVIISEDNKFDSVYPYRYLVVYNFETPINAMLLGHSTRYVGKIIPSDKYEQGYLTNAKTVKVIMAMPLNGNKFRNPVPILESQIIYEPI